MEIRAFDPKNTILGFWGQMTIFSPTTSIFFSEDVKNHVRKLLRGRKVGVTHEKMGI